MATRDSKGGTSVPATAAISMAISKENRYMQKIQNQTTQTDHTPHTQIKQQRRAVVSLVCSRAAHWRRGAWPAEFKSYYNGYYI